MNYHLISVVIYISSEVKEELKAESRGERRGIIPLYNYTIGF
jgi:hypothetical protein